MKNVIFAFAGAVLLLPAVATVVRPAADALSWQTVRNANDPLVWRWDAADSAATVTVSGLTAKVVVTAPVARQTEEAYGSFAIDLTDIDTSREQVFDVTVALGSGQSVRETLSARLAYLPSVTVGAVDVRPEGTRKWKKVGSEPVAIAYSSRWNEETAGAETAALTVEGSVRAETTPLPSVGGFTALAGEAYAAPGEEIPVSVAFDDESVATLQAVLRWTPGGLILLLR